MKECEEASLWALEQQFWLAGVERYERSLASNAIMVLPAPAGILDRAATLDAIRAAARWSRVSFTEQRCERGGPQTAVLVYVASADRGDAQSSYSAFCSSTYALEDGEWLLLLHHQTPTRPG